MGHIPHLFLARPWEGPRVPIDDAGLHHLRRALRKVDGDPVTYTDGDGVLGNGALENGSVVRGAETSVPRPQVPIIAVAAPTQKDRVRFLVEKVAELGTLELWWLRTRFGEGRPPAPDKAEAWTRSALEQSRSAWRMAVKREPVGISALPSGTVFADQSGADASVLRGASCIAVGPEGGWDEHEIPTGAHTVALGPTVLRIETAAVAAAVLANSDRARSSDHAQW